MIDRRIMQALRETIRKSDRRIYQMINERKKEYLVTKEVAANILAFEKGVNVVDLLSEEELAKLREIIRISPEPKQEKRVIKKIVTLKERIISVGDFRVHDPYLPNELVTQAIEMTRTYPIIYLFENSIRNLIMKVMERKRGSSWWDVANIPRDVRMKVEKRLKEEKENRWHGSKRGVHKIFYTDVNDLDSIIVNNWEDFENIFPNQIWIKSRLEEMKLSRNIIAHNNPLPKNEIKRLKFDYEDWIRQIKGTL